MPEISPRRSARARTSQSTPNLQHSNTSNSSSSAKQDRHTRVGARGESNGHSDIVQSPSSITSEARQPSEPETRQTRQKKREQNSNSHPSSQNANENDNEGPEEAEDDDVTRCVCGHSEYPGPPSSAVESSKGHNGRDNKNSNAPSTVDGTADDAGGLFIQCDECHVWQHGGCVGIMDEAKCPDQYYCDQCRPALHKVQSAAKGRKYSFYKPVTDTFTVPQQPPQRKHSATKEPERRPSKDSDKKAGSKSTAQAPGKRRSTMNSRAAWDDEELWRALEVSKGNNGASEPSTGSRKAKRPREGSEEVSLAKRLKAGSSPSTNPEPDASPKPDSDDRSKPKSKSNNGASTSLEDLSATRPKREDRRRDRDKDLDAADVANKRKGRADKRRPDDGEAEDVQSSSKIPATVPRPARQQANTKSTAVNTSPAVTSSNKKGGKAHPRRGKVGRNQYTKDRDLAADSKAEGGRPSHSRDGEEMQVGGDASGPPFSNGSKPSKPKHLSFNRTSLNEIRKRVAGIGEFISRTQVELAGERTPPNGSSPSSGKSKTNPLPRPATSNGTSKLNNEIHDGEENNAAASPDGQDPDQVNEGESKDDGEDKQEAEILSSPNKENFRKMTSTEMMDVISRGIVLWQKDYGKWGEK